MKWVLTWKPTGFCKLPATLCGHMTYLRGTEPASGQSRTDVPILLCSFSSQTMTVESLETSRLQPVADFWISRWPLSTSPHMLAWRKGKDYSYCMASNLFNCPWFFLNSRKNKNKSGAVGHLKTEAVERVQFSHVRVFSDSATCKNVRQNLIPRATA